MIQPRDRATESANASLRLTRLLQVVVAAAGLVLAALGSLAPSLHLPATRWRIESGWVLAAGVLALGLSWALRFVPARAAVGVASFVLALTAALAAGYRGPRRGDVLPAVLPAAISTEAAPAADVVWLNDREWQNPYTQPDERYGYRNRANVVARHEAPDFVVTYRTDAQGWRRCGQRPVPPGRELAFVGCSFTFGVGVEDGETFVARLAQSAWPERSVRNYGVGGWGTTQVALLVKELLAQDPPPAGILYGWIPHHRSRNDRRRAHHETTQYPFPWFELVAGKPQFRGLLPSSAATAEESPELVEREVRMSLALVRQMGEACRQRGVPFAVLVLDRRGPDPVIEQLETSREVALIDVSHLTDNRYPRDVHPTPVRHAQIAQALAGLEIWTEWLGDAAWRPRPELPEPGELWSLNIAPGSKADGRLRRFDERPPRLRLEPRSDLPPPVVPGLVLRQRRLLAAGTTYKIELEHRSDREQTLHLMFNRIAEDGPPELLSATRFSSGPTWQTITAEATCSAPDRPVELSLHLPLEAAPLEVRGTHLWNGPVDVLARPCQARWLSADAESPAPPADDQP